MADDPDGQAALDLWLEQRDDLLAGRKPRPDYSGLPLEDLCNHFLHHKKLMVKSGELQDRTWKRYKACCEFLLKQLGRKCPAASLRPDDFQELRASMAKKWGPVAISNEIQTTRSLFKYGYEAELLDKPVRFGPGFKKPSAKSQREAKLQRGPRMFTSQQIRSLLAVATPNMRAMILLAINGGLGNTDLGTLPRRAVDLHSGWLDWPRPKTAVMRRIPLWLETIEAINAMLAGRVKAKRPQDEELLFIGKRGESYVGNHKGYRVTQEFRRVCESAGVEGRSFYDLRRTFETIGEDCRDLVAVKAIMGHAPATGDMSAVYRQRIADDRLRAVVDVVHEWLYADPEDGDGDDADVVPFRIVG